jgi:hypothetical protein
MRSHLPLLLYHTIYLIWRAVSHALFSFVFHTYILFHHHLVPVDLSCHQATLCTVSALEPSITTNIIIHKLS